MDKFYLPYLIALITVFISVLLSFFLLTVKSKNRMANNLLSAFIIVCAIDAGGIIIAQYLESMPELYDIIKSVTFLIFPLFYLYVLSICYNNFKLRLSSLYHILPFAINNLLIVSISLFSKNDSLQFALQEFSLIFSTFILKLQAVIYLIAIIYVLRRYKKIYLHNYANGNINIYNWLFRIVLVFLITLPLSVLKDLSYFRNHQEIFIWTIVALTTAALLLFCWFVLIALYNPEFFRGVDPNIDTAKKYLSKKNDKRAFESKLDSMDSALIEQLRKHMIEKEPFLEPTLTLQELALQMNIPSRELSILINQHIGQHFFEFINKYRIEKALEIIEKSTKSEFTIQQIYFEVGFNSKSSFNTAFKKFTQSTPTAYRNLISSKTFPNLSKRV